MRTSEVTVQDFKTLTFVQIGISNRKVVVHDTGIAKKVNYFQTYFKDVKNYLNSQFYLTIIVINTFHLNTKFTKYI